MGVHDALILIISVVHSLEYYKKNIYIYILYIIYIYIFFLKSESYLDVNMKCGHNPFDFSYLITSKANSMFSKKNVRWGLLYLLGFDWLRG